MNIDFIMIITGLMMGVIICLTEWVNSKRRNVFKEEKNESKDESDKDIERDDIITDLFDETFKNDDFKDIMDFIPINYQKEFFVLKELKDLYDSKEKVVIKILQKKFDENEMSYKRFILLIDKCHEMIYDEIKDAFNLISYTSYSPDYIEIIFKKHFEKIEKIIEKIDELMNNLVMNERKNSTSEYKSLLEDMDSLNKSVYEYYEKDIN